MRPTLDEVLAAQGRIAGHVRRTPTVKWALEGQPAVTLKLEQLQVGGSFKARGACNRLLSVQPEALTAGVVTASGGNHGLGVAWAAHRFGRAATVFLPQGAPASTERRLLALGARVERGGAAWDDAWQRAEVEAARTGALLVHPFEDYEVIAGAGTVGLELVEEVPDLELAIVAVGGGGLIAGTALALRALKPGVRVIGVEPTGATSMKDSLAAGRVVALESVRTIAGTLAPRAVGPRTLALCAAHVEEVVLVEDEELRQAMRLLWSELRILVEPAGAAAVAALVSGRVPVGAARSIAVLICGANLDAPLAVATLEPS
jgi:threonine dehydratase